MRDAVHRFGLLWLLLSLLAGKPLLANLQGCAGIFCDDFETGDTSAWALTVTPPPPMGCATGVALVGALEGDLAPAPGGSFDSITCLEIRNDRAVERGPELAISSIPMAASIGLLSTDDLALIGPGDRYLAAQFDVLSRWGGTPDDPTRPIRWLQVTVPARVAADAATYYELRRYDTLPSVVDEFAVAITEDVGGTLVDTGLALFTLDATNAALIDSIAIDPDDDPDGGAGLSTVYNHSMGAGPRLVFNPGGGAITLGTPAGATVDAGGFEVVELGPVKAVVAMRGHFSAAGGESLCVTSGGSLTYERFGFTAVMTFERGRRDIGLQVQLRNECSDGTFEPWTDEAIGVDSFSWVLPFSGLSATASYHAGGGAVSSGSGSAAVRVEQRLGADPGSGWVRSAEVTVGAATTESAEVFEQPIVGFEDSSQLLVTGQMPWMRFREPQALSVDGTTMSLDLVSRPITLGEGRGLWNFATVHLVPASLVEGGGVVAVEALRQRDVMAQERGLLVRAPRDHVNAAGIFPSLGNDGTSTVKTHYLTWMEMLHSELIGAGWDDGKVFGSQVWPESGGADPFGHAANNPDEWSGSMNYWDPAGNEMLEFLRSGDPKWVWDFALPAYWTQAFSAYLNLGDRTHSNRNGVAVQSGGPGCADFIFPCTPTGSGGGQWHRSNFGSDDYTYDMSLELGYALRPNAGLRRRFAQAGRTVDDRYDIPRADQGTRECFVNQVNITRQVIQHFEMLANCAEFVPGAEGQACHDKLIEVYDEFALDNLNAGLMCQRVESDCFGNPPPAATQCFSPQQFMVNSLMYAWFDRLWRNYGEPPSSTSAVRDALVCGPAAQYEWAIPKLVDGVSIDPTFGANCNTANGQGCWWGVMDCTLSGDQSSIVSCQSALDSDGNFFMAGHTRPHTLYPLMVAQQIEPDLALCNVVKTVLDDNSFAGDPADNQGGWAGVGHFLPIGWWKGTSQMMQGMVFAVGIYDTCEDPPAPQPVCQ